MTSSLSIILPTYNRSSRLQTTIKQLLSTQTLPLEYELIVVDNCSSDDTRDIVASFARSNARIKLIANKSNVRASRSIFIGLSQASFDIVLILTDDELIIGDYIGKVINMFDTSPSTGLILSSYNPNSPEPFTFYRQGFQSQVASISASGQLGGMSWRRHYFNPLDFPLITQQNYPQVYVALYIAHRSDLIILHHDGLWHPPLEDVSLIDSWASQKRPADLGIRERASYIFAYQNLVLSIYACKRFSSWAYTLLLDILGQPSTSNTKVLTPSRFLYSLPRALGIGCCFLVLLLFKNRKYNYASLLLFYMCFSPYTYISLYFSLVLLLRKMLSRFEYFTL